MATTRRGVLNEGRFGWGGRGGMALSEGWFITRREGGFNVYRSRYGVSGFDRSQPIAACGANRSSLTVAVGATAGDSWLAVTRVSGFGLESDECAWIRVRANGATIAAVPAAVMNLRPTYGRNGSVALCWEYESPWGWPEPSEFCIYVVGPTKAINYNVVRERVPYRRSQRLYLWRGGVITSTAMRFAVRAVTAEGVHDGSTASLVALGDTSFPGTIGEVGLRVV